ncbi:MAG: V-type ATPase subunit [Clostridia bacterium]|nr:V-type ATPase subunit [Clostridia bacterium]
MALVSNIYANTLASQNEKQLLDDDKLRRIIDSDYDGALKLLSDYGFGDAQTVGKSADEIINAETDKLVAFVREYAHSDSVRDVLLSQFAFNNVKAAYKAMSSGIKVPEGSIYPAFKDYADMVVAKEYDDLPAEIKETLTRLDEKAEEGLSASEIDIELSKAEYRFKEKKSALNKKLHDYVVSQAMLTNVLTLIRCYNLSRSALELRAQLLPVKKLDYEAFEVALSGSRDQLKAFIEDCGFDEIIGEIGEHGEKIADIEKNVDEYLYLRLVSGREAFTSSAPFVKYFYRKSLELKMVKTVLVCIKNGRTEELKRRLRKLDD